MSRRLHLERAQEYARCYDEHGWRDEYPEWIDGAWHDVTDDLMSLYHYIMAYAPRGTLTDE